MQLFLFQTFSGHCKEISESLMHNQALKSKEVLLTQKLTFMKGTRFRRLHTKQEV